MNDALDRFRELVARDPELSAHLRRVDPSRFTEEVRRMAADRGLDVTEADVEEAAFAGGRAWGLRWVQ